MGEVTNLVSFSLSVSLSEIVNPNTQIRSQRVVRICESLSLYPSDSLSKRTL